MIHSPRASFTKFLYSILNILEPILPIEKKEILESILSSGKLEENTEKILVEIITKLKKNFNS